MLIGKIDRLTEEKTALQETLNELSTKADALAEYKDRCYELVRNPQSLAEFCYEEHVRYNHAVLADICAKMNKVFADGPFKGVEIELQYPPFAYGRPAPNWNGHGEIISLTVRNAKGKLICWSQENGGLDAMGNHIWKDGTTYNVVSGKHITPQKKEKREWRQSEKTLRPK